MRTASANTIAALNNAKLRGLKPRNFIWFVAKNRTTGSPQSFGFHGDIDTFDVTVINGETNLPITNTYYGDGAIRHVSRIPLTVGLTIRRVSIELSNVHAAVNDMVRGYDVRNAKVQIHRGILDPDTNLLVDNPMVHFMGTVDSVEPLRPSVGSEGGVSVECVSITNELTRTNPARASDAYQRSRSDDRMLRYVDIMGDVKVVWGSGK